MNLRVLVVPDSFKGTLRSAEAGEAIRLGIRDVCPDARIDVFAMADGGEGSSEIIAQTMGAKRREKLVCGPEGKPVPGFYFFTEDQVAYIELAAASGFSLVSDRSTSAKRATTYGTGQLIHDALSHGAKKIFLFVGGSATTDGGVGIAKALGFSFFNEQGEKLFSCEESPEDFSGEGLNEIARIEAPPVGSIPAAEFLVIADVENPLFGSRGAAAVYAPQKGASPEDVSVLDKGLRNLASVVKRDLSCDIEQLPGTGAAGGACYGMMCFLGAKRLRGPSFFLDIIAFDERMKLIDVIITGEGRLDVQSLEGKLLPEIYRRSESAGLPVLSLSGLLQVSEEDLARFPRLIPFGLGRSDALSDPSQALRSLARQVSKVIEILPRTSRIPVVGERPANENGDA